MEQNETSGAIFVFETSDPKVVTITLSDLGKETIGDDTTSTFEDLLDNIDQNFRTAGYMYDVQLTDDGITIKPFEDGEDFNQEVFNLIAEELSFMDNLVHDQEIEDEMEL